MKKIYYTFLYENLFVAFITSNPLKLIGYYMYHLLKHLVTLHFVHSMYLWVSYGSQNK
jgi:hypothetical protein